MIVSKYIDLEKYLQIDKPKNEDLAKYLNKSVHTTAKYPKEKKELMMDGLRYKKLKRKIKEINGKDYNF